MYFRFLLLLCGASCAAAQSTTLDLDDAIRTAWANDPTIAALSLTAELAGAREEQAGIRPNPEVELRGGAPLKGDSEWTAGVGLSQRLPRRERIEQARALARLGGAVVQPRLREQQRHVAGEVRRIYYEVAVLQSRRTAAQRTIQAHRDLRAVLDRRHAVGEIGSAEIDLLGIETARAEQAFALAEAELAAAMQRLRSRLRLPDDAALIVTTDVGWLVARAIPEKPADLSAARPSLALAAHRVREAEAALALAGSQTRGDWTVGAGVDFERRANDYDGRLENEPQFSVRASAPWQRRVANRGEIQERQALIRIAEAELSAMRDELTAEIAAAIGTAKALQPVLASHQALLNAGPAIPQSLQAAYERGEVTSLQMAQARQLRFALETDTLDAAMRYAAALAEAETAAGVVPAQP